MNNQKVPKIRFKGFSGDWEQRKLGDIAGSFEYGLNAAAKEFDGQNKYIRITDIDDTTHEFLQTDLTSPDTNMYLADNYRLSKGDILFARTGASVGKTYIYKETDGLAYYAGFLIRARIKEKYDPKFVFQNTLTPAYENYIRITSQRSGQPGVNAQEYAEYELMVPSLPEQRKIGAVLQDVDNLITLHQSKLDKLKIIKKSMLENCFPKNGENVPKFRFSGFTGDWEQRKLGELGKARSGIGFPDAEQGGKEGVPFYKVSDMNNVGNEHEMVAANNHVTREQIARKGWKPIDEVPAIFFAKVGAAVLLNRKRLCRFPFLLDNNTMAYSIDGSALDADFAITLFDTIDLTSLVQVGALPSYNSGDVENIDVVIPKMSEQRKIGAYFKRIDSLITLHQSKLDKLKVIKKTLLESMFV